MESNVTHSDLGLSVFYDEAGPAIVVKKHGGEEARLPCSKMTGINPGERNEMALAFTGQAIMVMALIDHPDYDYGGVTVKEVFGRMTDLVTGETADDRVRKLAMFVSTIVYGFGTECAEALVRDSECILDMANMMKQGRGGRA